MYSRELFDRYVINVLRLRTDFSVTGSDKGVKFSWKHTIQASTYGFKNFGNKLSVKLVRTVFTANWTLRSKY